MRFGLSVFGTTYAMGLHPRAGRPKISAEGVINLALQNGLQGVELPLSMLADCDHGAIASKVEANQLYITIASDGFDAARLGEAFDTAKSVGAKVVRTVAGGAKFGGDRRHLVGKWQSFLEEARVGLTAATALAEEAGVILALENHQDLCSEELIWLCESIASPNFGLTLDTGNPLATAEEPVEFAKRISPYLKHVHLKDYWIYPSAEGYMLVRCPIGQGAVDFPALMEVFRASQAARSLCMSIEIGALEARHTRVLADDYWPEYPARSARELAELLRCIQRNARPTADWRTPHERGESVEIIAAYEQSQLMSSIAYVQQLMNSLNTSKPEEEVIS